LNRKLLFLIVGLFAAAFAHGQVAGIKATPVIGCAPLTVLFNDNSTGGVPTSWNWNFGYGGATSTAQNPNYTYFAPGTYTVTLKINNGSTATQTITVNAPPTVYFKGIDSSGCFPLNVQFTDSSKAGSGGITGFRWDFGDGDTSNLKNPSHIYRGAANYPVTLQVIDQNGCASVLTKTGYIKIPNGVTASFATIAASGCKFPITIQLNNTSTGVPGFTNTYTWSFGDGSANSNATSPPHTYNASGTFNIKLIAQSPKGCIDSITVRTSILAGNVSSSFQAPDSICVNSPINFLNTSAPKPSVSNWDFGDGTSSSQISVYNKTFTAAGVYTIKLTNTFGACIDSISKQITVLIPAVANFTGSPTTGCDSLFTVNFTDQSAGASSWFWSFGDGSTSNKQSPTHTYIGYGKYSITLQVSNATGCTGSITKTQYIQNGKPFIQLSKINSAGCAPFSFSPILIDTVVDGIKTYSWDFGDGTTSTSANPPAHSYPSAGTYYVKLSVTTNGGCSASTIDTVLVGTIKPVASFTASRTTACVNSPITFTDHSTNNPNSWLWTFGDGNSSTIESPAYSYKAPGTFIATLRAYNNGCNDSAKTTIIVNPPLAKFDYTFSCAGNNTVFDFHDSSQGADTWAWDFGDGSPILNSQNPTHAYAIANGTYTATLTVKDSTTGCTNGFSKPIYIIKDTANYVFTAYNVCRNQSIQITVFNVNHNDISLYHYDWGDGTPVDVSNNSFGFHSYTKTGNFTVKVVLTLLSGCLDTLALNKTPPPIIHVSGPTANFTTSGTGVGCTGLAATFTDQSTSDGVDAIKQWIWDFGDSTPVQTFSGPPFAHNYPKQGIYSVKLKVVDASGCADSITKINLITVAFPNANFTTVDSLSCPGSPIQFVNNSKGYGLAYAWDFGDGSPTSNAQNPAHIYAKGTWKASLNVIDQFGCAASIGNYNILIDTPSASFTINDTFASCPPLTANFTFTGSYAKSLRWTFGDGGISFKNPTATHFYNLPGNYTAGLIVTSHGGCTATAPNVNIRILGPTGSLSYSPLQGCHILNVNFNLTTNNNVTNYLWLFSSTQADSTKIPSASFTYDSIGKYIPIVVLRDSTGCNVPIIGVDTIVVLGSKPNFGYDNNIFCASGTVQFSDSSFSTGTISNWFWDFGDGGTSTSQNPSHFYASPGSYSVKLVVATQANCQDSITVSNLIKVVAYPVIGIIGDNEKCAPALMNFQGEIIQIDTSAFTWHWVFGNGKIDSVQNPAAQLYPVAGIDTVKLTATNSSNCSTTISEVIKIDSVAATNAGPDTAICVGQSAFLHASSSASPVTYTWLPPTNGTLSCINCSNPIATPGSTTSYYVQGINTFGCGTTDTIVVNVVQPATMNVSPLDDSVCLGQSVQLAATGEMVYTWSPASGLSNPSIGNPTARPDSTTIYQVTGSDSIFCFPRTQSVLVNVFKYPTIDLGPKVVTIPVGSSYQINGIGSADIDSINWAPTIGLSCASCLSPLASPISTTTYVVKVENNGGCITADSIRIIVTCDGKNLFVPNTFSPNGDGMNDWFYVQGKGLTTIQSLRIFNRWGQLVFEKINFAPNAEQDGWDGNFNGRKAPVDVYIYTIEVVCENSQVVAYHGNVALIR